jgi:formate hydrogenlyase regulatory protein HycA
MAGVPLVRVPYEDSDDSNFNCVGVHKQRQFLACVTGADPWDEDLDMPAFPNPADPGWTLKKRWYGVVHLFDFDGNHTQTVAFLGGTTADGKAEACDNAFAYLNDLILSMEDPVFQDIRIKPFQHLEDGYLFGLLYDDGEEGESATLWPNDIMFHEPWDGKYST